VLDTHVVTLPKCLAIVAPYISRNIGMTILIAIIYVRSPVIFDILPGTFDAVMEPLSLKLTILTRGLIPAARTLSIARAGRWSLRWSIPLSDKGASAAK
jgi:hypothetical protein